MKKFLGLVFGFFVLIAAYEFYKYYDLNFSGDRKLSEAPPQSNAVVEFDSTPTNTTAIPLILPNGFSISIFAKDLGAPRVLQFDPRGTLLVSVPARGTVVALADENGDGVVDQTVTVVSGLDKPHGIAFHNDKLYVAETALVAVYDYDSTYMKASNKKKIIDLPGGGNHFSRTIGFGPDERLYISVGSSCNVCNEKDPRRASMLVSDADGKNLKTFAKGLRNSVFFIWGSDGRLWATEMGRDL